MKLRILETFFEAEDEENNSFRIILQTISAELGAFCGATLRQ